MILEMIFGNKERRKFRKALKEIKTSLSSDFVCKYVSEDNVRYASEILSETKLSLNDVKVDLDKLIGYFVENGAEEVALEIAEEFEYPLTERQSLAQKSYLSLKNHIKDSNFGGALFCYSSRDTFRSEFQLARITRNYQIQEANLEDHVNNLIYSYKDIHPDASKRDIKELIGRI